jgi:sugar lactone lactonase YvrE
MLTQIFFDEYRGALTEGARYDNRNDTLAWVDIIAAEIHRVCLKNPEASHEVIKVSEPSESIGAIALTSNPDVLVACAKYGVGYANFQTGKFEYFLKYPHETSRLRSNDGIVDPWGHLWIGVMTDFHLGDVVAEGKLYRINCHSLQVETMIDHCYIPNGMAFSSDGRKLFWTDSIAGTIVEYDYDVLRNQLSNKREVLNVKKSSKYKDFAPDGMCMTKTNNIFGAMFNGSRVVHVDSVGNVVEDIAIPAQCVTNAHIGGANNDQLFVNTAHIDHEEKDFVPNAKDKKGDLGGYLFKVQLERSYEPQPNYIWGGTVKG